MSDTLGMDRIESSLTRLKLLKIVSPHFYTKRADEWEQ